MTYVITSRPQPRSGAHPHSLPERASPSKKFTPRWMREGAGIADRGHLISRHFLLTEVSLLFAPPPTSRGGMDMNVGISDGFLEMHLKLSNHPSSILVSTSNSLTLPKHCTRRWTKAYFVLTFAACSAHYFSTVTFLTCASRRDRDRSD